MNLYDNDNTGIAVLRTEHRWRRGYLNSNRTIKLGTNSSRNELLYTFDFVISYRHRL